MESKAYAKREIPIENYFARVEFFREIKKVTTKKELAEKIGVSLSCVEKWWGGNGRVPSPVMCSKIRQAYGV